MTSSKYYVLQILPTGWVREHSDFPTFFQAQQELRRHPASGWIIRTQEQLRAYYAEKARRRKEAC